MNIRVRYRTELVHSTDSIIDERELVAFRREHVRISSRYVFVQAKTRIPRITHRLAQVPEDGARTRRLQQDCYGQKD
jgi:hypothetical protein